MQYLETWKDFSHCLGKSIRHLKKLHYEVQKIPFVKTTPNPQGRVIIKKNALLEWYDRVIHQLGKLSSTR